MFACWAINNLLWLVY